MAIEYIEIDEKDQDLVDLLDGVVLSNVVDLKKHPIPDSYITSVNQYILKEKQKAQDQISKLDEEANAIHNNVATHGSMMTKQELDAAADRLDEIDDLKELILQSFDHASSHAQFNAEVQWRYSLAQTFVSARTSFLGQLFASSSAKDNEDIPPSTTIH